LSLQRGRIQALIGPNGAGKTTALAQLSGELQPDAGRIYLRGEDITAMRMAQRARIGIARSFQITAIFPEFTVLDNVCTAVQAGARHHFHFWRHAGRDRRLLAPAHDALEQVALAPLAARRDVELAHGWKRKLEIAMALCELLADTLMYDPLAGQGSAN